MDFFSNYHEYHLKLTDNLKTVLYQKDNSIFDKLDFYDDDVFSEPFLFSCINNNKYDEWIETIVFSLCKQKENHSSIITSSINGKIIYLPNIGYLKLEKATSQKVQIKYLDEKIVLLDTDNNILNYSLQPLYKNHVGIEFLKYNHPLIEPLFVDEKGIISEVSISDNLYKKHIKHFNQALETINVVYPEYFNLVVNYIKKVVFYEGEPNSFATIQAHGIAFFNVKDDYNEIFFLDNIMHQCAHVFFNTLTLNKDGLFTMPHTSDLAVFTEEENDKGFTLYDRFHGLFTQTNINICIERCILKQIYHEDEHFELLGRFTSNMNRFSLAISKFDRPKKYKKIGLEWFNFFNNTFIEINKRNKILLSQYDTSNQSYVFDYKIFKKTNVV